jgi:hypothetical protein
VDLLTLLFRLPFLPARAVIRLAEIIREEAEREYYSPSAARRELEETEHARRTGEISDQDVSRMEYDALARMMPEPGKPPAQAGFSGEEE